MRRITIDELEEKTKQLKDIITEANIDIRYWLEELSPKKRLQFPYDPNEKLSSEEKKERTNEWRGFYKDNYRHLREHMLEKVFSEIENSFKRINNSEEIITLLIEYFDDGSSSIQNQSSELVKLFDLTAIISRLIHEMKSMDDEISKVGIKKLEKLNLNRNQWIEKKLSMHTNDLIEVLKFSLQRPYKSSSPNFYIFGIIDQLSESIPEEISKLQNELVKVTNYNKLGYRDYESIMYMYSRCWNEIKMYWDPSNIERLQKEIDTIAKEKYQKGDIWVEQYVLPALKVVGKGNERAEKTIEWIKSE